MFGNTTRSSQKAGEVKREHISSWNRDLNLLDNNFLDVVAPRQIPGAWPCQSGVPELVVRDTMANHLPTNTATNGPSPGAPLRGSPAPPGSQGPPVPNGKPTSPYVERSNPMGPAGQVAAQTVSSKDPKAAAQAASDMRNVVRRKLTGYVGFANLPNQWHRKSVRKGFNFNVMVVGKIIL